MLVGKRLQLNYSHFLHLLFWRIIKQTHQVIQILTIMIYKSGIYQKKKKSRKYYFEKSVYSSFKNLLKCLIIDVSWR